MASEWPGRIAQLVEQLTLNQRVQGSNPCAPTTLRNISTDFEVLRISVRTRLSFAVARVSAELYFIEAAVISGFDPA